MDPTDATTIGDGAGAGEPLDASSVGPVLSPPVSSHPAGAAPPIRPSPSPRAPLRLPTDPGAAYPETLRYRLKNKLLGPPLTTERLSTERLGRPTALAVLSSDVISSSAYATEQALIPLIKVIGVAAFSLIVPVSIAVIVVLAFVTLSYLEVVKVYTKAGGAYVVARENFGLTVAQIAAVSLLIDYTLTVAVSVAAGVAALTSAVPSLTHATVWLAIALVVVISFANLRGVREAGKVFALPTYFFVANMVLLLVVGAVRGLQGDLHAHAIHVTGAVPIGTPGSGWLYGASLFWILRSFASGGSALTGTEAISNGVSVFRQPEARNARITMVWMAVILGTLVMGVSILASITHPVPYELGTPTVVSQIAKYVYGTSGLGTALYWLLQVGTMFILVLAANTSFTGFPFLASFAAEDSYMPRQLTKRGHRLVFSTGILVLTGVSIALLLITRAQVDALIPLYAIGVFTGFTMAGAGMVKYHQRTREAHWRRRAVINGSAAVLSFIVDIVIILTKFSEGAWAIVIILPLGVLALLRLHRQYEKERVQLETGAVEVCEAPILRRHVVIVLVDSLDMATARALQYARQLTPDDLRAVHFDIDNRAARELEREWNLLQLGRLPLDIIECPDRRLTRATVELVAGAVIDGDTECTVLLPRRSFTSAWRRFLHDRTADRIAAVLSQVPHVSATFVPFALHSRWADQGRHLWGLIGDGRVAGGADGGAGRRSEAESVSPVVSPGTAREAAAREIAARGTAARGTAARGTAEGGAGAPAEAEGRSGRRSHTSAVDAALARRSEGTREIESVEWRQRVKVAGRVRSVRVQPRGGTSNLECVLSDRSGALLLVFQGRPRIPGIEPGARLVAEGMVGEWGRRLAILNPDYELVAGPDADSREGG